MNFLFHMLLSGDDDQLMVGNFMGDFVKGPLAERFPERIRQGVHLHRRMDSFAGRSGNFNSSRLRIDSYYGLYRGVLVDLFYDHFLARSWNDWSDERFEAFLARSRSVVEHYHHDLPERMQPLIPYIFNEMLPSYVEVHGISQALERMSRRVRRVNPLAGGEKELLRHYDDLLRDFRAFMPEISAFVSDALVMPPPR